MNISANGNRARILNCGIDRLDMEQTLDRCRTVIETRGYAQHMAVNAAKIVSMQDDPRLAQIVNGCELVNADGQSVVWASRVLRDPVPTRVAGIDLMLALCELAEREGWSVFYVGARQEVLDKAIARLKSRLPALKVAGSHHGYFKPEEDEQVCDIIRASGADILFVAMSSPRKEYWLAEHGPTLEIPFVMGVGGAVDVVSGLTRRAPVSWQRLGLEWLYRTLQEPRRLAPRYLRTNGRFAGLVLREVVERRVAGG